VTAPATERTHTAPAVDHDVAEARALLQERVVRFAGIITIVTLAFYPLGLLARGLIWNAGPHEGFGVFGASSALHLFAACVFGATWWFARRGAPTTRALRVADAIMTLGGAVTLELMTLAGPSGARADLYMIFVVSQVLAIRATLIPCTVRGSRGVAVAALAPVPWLTYLKFTHEPLPNGPAAGALVANSLVNILLVYVVTSLVSNTVHGLRERVRKAMKLGQYTLERKIGEGGMGVVYKASHALLRRPTAIKLLPPERAGEHNLVRFEREVQLTSMLTHPNTVSIYDFGRTPEGTFYYAMEYLEGFDLETLVRVDGPQPPGRVVHLLAQVCGALAEAHAVGLIHRDVKPANILLCERGGTPDVVKVLDFGLVKQLGPARESTVSHNTGRHIIGTPLYLSPEAISAPDDVDGRSDLYALGCVGYMLLTGAPPFTGRSVVEVCGHHLHTAPEPPSERAPHGVPAELEAIVLRCLAKSPDERFADASGLAQALLASSSARDWTPERAASWWATRGTELRREAEEILRSSSGESPSVILTRAVS
jgi:serine/threonine-protein kinase